MMREYRFDQIAIVSTEKKKPTESDKENYVGLEHLSPDTFEVVEYGSEVPPKGEKLVMRKGDVLFGKRRAYQRKVGIAPCDGIFSAHGMVLRPSEEVIDARFFPFFIKSDAFLDEAIRISVGSLSPTVNWRDLRELRFRLPSLDRQREVAELLWAGEDLKTTYRSLLLACGEQVKSRFVEMFGDDDWPVSTLDELADVQGGLTKNKRREHLELQLPYLRVANVLQGKFDLAGILTIGLTEAEREKTLLRKDDLLFVEGNGSKEQIGRSAIWDASIDPCVHQNHLIRARFSKLIVPIYAATYFTTMAGREQIVSQAVSTSGLFTLSTRKIKSLRVPVPPIECQREFASFVQQVDKSEFLRPNSSVGFTVTKEADSVFVPHMGHTCLNSRFIRRRHHSI